MKLAQPPPEIPGNWPNRGLSRMIDCGPLRWHVQDSGPDGEAAILLLHGSGASTHSWRDVLPILARRGRVIAVDLPGQGFTKVTGRGGLGLEDMARALSALIGQQGWAVRAIVGHSAGAAIALQLCLDLRPPPVAVVGINAALGDFEGMSGVLFPIIAQVLATTSLTARLFAATASPDRVRRLVSGTGSRIDARGLALYERLIRDPDHVDATLRMMANWRLGPLTARLGAIRLPVLLITGDCDRAVPPAVSEAAARKLPAAEVVPMPGLGHLCHEEDPEGACKLILGFLDRQTGA